MKTQTQMYLQKIVLISALLVTTSCLEQNSTAEKAVSPSTAATRQVASFAIAPPIPTDPIDCTFNTAVVTDGTPVTAFQNSTVPFGSSCVSESRLCTAGALSGSYQFASCTVGAAAGCLFNGATMNHGDSVTGYTTSTVAFGQVCSTVAETRTCNNGVLSGSATFAACDIAAARSCLFDGKTVLHGASIVGYQTSTSQFGGSCTQELRTCSDGTLSGSFTFGSCTIDQPASCLFDGRTLAHGEVVAAFQASSSAFGTACIQENRTCSNGTLSGSYLFGSCTVNQPASCSLNNNTVASGASIVAYESATVPFGGSCLSEARSCTNGTLSGSFTNALCAVSAASDCTLNGQTVLHGSSVTTYATASVPAGQTCTSEVRTCSNGTLSGSLVVSSCVVDAPVVVVNPPPSCNFNGRVIPSDMSVTAFQSATVAFGQTCASESRQCLDGALTGSYTNSTCTVSPAASCTLNGKTIASGSSATVFTSSSVPAGQVCKSEVRSCNNGVLSGTAVSETCVVLNPPPPPPAPVVPGTCQPSAIIWEFPSECRGQCGKGNGYFKSRISQNGGKTWLTIQKNKLPEDLKEIWNYMIKQNGKNSCGRPNVNYSASKNKGYVVLDVKKVPDCKVCRFVEVEQKHEKEHEEREHREHGSCHKEKEHKKVMKFLCGEIKEKKHHGHEHDDEDEDDDRDHDRDDHDDDHHSSKHR